MTGHDTAYYKKDYIIINIIYRENIDNQGRIIVL